MYGEESYNGEFIGYGLVLRCFDRILAESCRDSFLLDCTVICKLPHMMSRRSTYNTSVIIKTRTNLDNIPKPIQLLMYESMVRQRLLDEKVC